jgi:hypothetical protein
VRRPSHWCSLFGRDLQFKWMEPEETGGRAIQCYVLEMLPPPLGWEGPPNAEVRQGHGVRWERRGVTGATGSTHSGSSCFNRAGLFLGRSGSLCAAAEVLVAAFPAAAVLQACMCGCQAGQGSSQGDRLASVVRSLQGWYTVYSGLERSYAVKRLQPGVRYAARVKVRGWV